MCTHHTGNRWVLALCELITKMTSSHWHGPALVLIHWYFRDTRLVADLGPGVSEISSFSHQFSFSVSGDWSSMGSMASGVAVGVATMRLHWSSQTYSKHGETDYFGIAFHNTCQRHKPDNEIRWLKEKIDCGVSFIFIQMFYDYEPFISWVKGICGAGITWSCSHPNMERFPTCHQLGSNHDPSTLPRRDRALFLLVSGKLMDAS